MNQCELTIGVVVSVPFEENTYILHHAGSDQCLIVDPGLEPIKIMDYLNEHKLKPAAILNTHGHSDHIAGNSAMKERWPEVPLVIGKDDAPKLTDPQLNLSANYGIALISPEADKLLTEGQTYSAAGFDLHVLETPGHCIGHIVFVYKEHSPQIVIGGDVLFAGSIGRTDFSDGSFEQIQASIHNKLFTLPDDTIVLPGHGPQTTIGQEKATNPFVGRPSGYQG